MCFLGAKPRNLAPPATAPPTRPKGPERAQFQYPRATARDT